MIVRTGVVTALLTAWSLPVLAHIQLIEPDPRYGEQKDAPCGRGGADARTDRVTVLPPGATITVRWDEGINHPGHFRIAFDDEGTDGFIDPVSRDDFDNSPAVLADDIPDTPSGGGSTFTVTLPDIECDACTLQVIQVMYDKSDPLAPGRPFGDDDFYYQCADLTLSSSAPDAGPEPGPGGSDGCSATGTGGGAMFALLVLAPLALVRRRSRAV
jgi:uncharacterized protein (TIGR03382 family)